MNSLYGSPRLPAIYDALYTADEVDEFYLRLAREKHGNVLDVGCGTGRLTVRFAESGLETWGVDPSSDMLDRARHRERGHTVSWHHAPAHQFAINETFAFALMTGHAFQCLMDDQSTIASLANIGRHLDPDGLFVFESRNPNVQEWLDWTPAKSRETVTVPGIGLVTVHNTTSPLVAGKLSYDTVFDLPSGEQLITTDQLRFPSHEEIAQLLKASGFERFKFAGGWHGEVFDPEISKEIVVCASTFRSAQGR